MNSGSLVLPRRTDIAIKPTWRLTEPQVLFLTLFVVYFGVACYLALVANVVYTDAWSRVASAQRVLFSRDPHLAAIGFYWSPLPAIALLPLVPLKALWPQLTTAGLAGGIVSSASMSAAVVQLRGLLLEGGLDRVLVLLISAAVALHPTIVLYAANGMSEAMLLAFLIASGRYLARWLRDHNTNDLIVTGFTLAFAYLSRYESLGATIGVALVVFGTGFTRVRRERQPISAVISDVAIVGAPAALAVGIWTVSSWLITGEPLNQISSVYDTHNQLAAIGYANTPGSSMFGIALMAGQLGALEPFLPVVAILVMTRIRAGVPPATIATIAPLGAILALLMVAELIRALSAELRYLILAIPLTAALAGLLLADRAARNRQSLATNRLTALACVVSLFAAIPTSSAGLLSPTINGGSGNVASLRAAFLSGPPDGAIRETSWSTERQIAADLDALHLKRGSVLLDDFLGFPIVVSSNDPSQFVITSDRDFRSVLADPKGTGIRYILVPKPIGMGELDAINRQYPDMFETGAGFAQLVSEYESKGVNDETWRLYGI